MESKIPLSNPYAKLAESIFRLAEVIFATRETAYNRKLDKKQERAIQYAEEYMDKTSELFVYIHEEIGVPEDKVKGFSKIKTALYKLKGKFNKND